MVVLSCNCLTVIFDGSTLFCLNSEFMMLMQVCMCIHWHSKRELGGTFVARLYVDIARFFDCH